MFKLWSEPKYKKSEREKKMDKAEKEAWGETIKLGVMVFLGFVILIILFP